MHDANHGTYSPNKKVNNLIGHILEIIGGYTVTLRIQHNVLHHTYTNIVAGFLLMHFVAGLSLACIFQPSHVMETSAFTKPVTLDGKKKIEDTWAVHEVINTADFAPNSRFFSWFIGGLNYQIEHHLFTEICHVHYRKIAPIIKSTTLSFGIPYHVQPTFLKALLEHAKMLKKLGREA